MSDYYDGYRWDWTDASQRQRKPKRKKPNMRKKRGAKRSHPIKPRCAEVGEDGRTRAQELRDIWVTFEVNGWTKKGFAWWLGVSRQMVHLWLDADAANAADGTGSQPAAIYLIYLREKQGKRPPYPRDYKKALKLLEEDAMGLPR